MYLNRPCIGILHALSNLPDMVKLPKIRSWIPPPETIFWIRLREGSTRRGADAVIDKNSHHMLSTPQALYYSVHIKYYIWIHTIVITDNSNTLHLVQNDAQIQNFIPTIGQNQELSFPNECVIFGDNFPEKRPFCHCKTHWEINRRPGHQQKLCRKLNLKRNKYRVNV